MTNNTVINSLSYPQIKLRTKRKKLPWVLKWASAWLYKLADEYALEKEPYVEHHTVTLDDAKIANFVFEQLTQLQINGRRGVTLLVGQDFYHGVMGDIHRTRMAIDYRSGAGQHTQYLGLDVVIVPWMKGALVLPELK